MTKDKEEFRPFLAVYIDQSGQIVRTDRLFSPKAINKSPDVLQDGMWIRVMHLNRQPKAGEKVLSAAANILVGNQALPIDQAISHARDIQSRFFNACKKNILDQLQNAKSNGKTMAVKRPDGHYMCFDDTDGQHMVISANGKTIWPKKPSIARNTQNHRL